MSDASQNEMSVEDGEPVSTSQQFTSIPMESIIGTPLEPAAGGQALLARPTAELGDMVDLDPSTAGRSMNEVRLEVPLLGFVNVPTLRVDRVDIRFDLETNTSVVQTRDEEFGFGTETME